MIKMIINTISHMGLLLVICIVGFSWIPIIPMALGCWAHSFTVDGAFPASELWNSWAGFLTFWLSWFFLGLFPVGFVLGNYDLSGADTFP